MTTQQRRRSPVFEQDHPGTNTKRPVTDPPSATRWPGAASGQSEGGANVEGERGSPPARVLVVEDEESFVDALTVNLEREGFSVTAARDGVEALERFALDQPDLVLLDVMLPRLSGIDVCRAMRANSSVPIIMVTAKSTELDTVVGLEVGADDYVAKPYRVHELVSRMRAVLRRAASDHAGGNLTPGASGARPQRQGIVEGDDTTDADRAGTVAAKDEQDRAAAVSRGAVAARRGPRDRRGRVGPRAP